MRSTTPSRRCRTPPAVCCESLETNQPPRDREVEAEKARARSRQRFEFGGADVQRPVRASELTQPTIRDLALSMSFFEKKSSGFTLSTG